MLLASLGLPFAAGLGLLTIAMPWLPSGAPDWLNWDIGGIELHEAMTMTPAGKAMLSLAAGLWTLAYLVPLLCLYAINYVVSTVVARSLLPRGDAIALVYGTVMRNLSIALALAMNVFGGQSAGAALVIALAYILQVQSAAWYVKLTDRLFGPAPAKTAKAG